MWTEIVTVPVLLVVALVLPLIAHELGHLVTGMLLGAKPRRLVFGWRGRVWWIGTVFGLPVIVREWPQDGYVAFDSLPASRWARAAISFAGPGINLLIGAVTLGTLDLWRVPDGTRPILLFFAFLNAVMGTLSLRRKVYHNVGPDLPYLESDGLSIWRQLFPGSVVPARKPWGTLRKIAWVGLAVFLSLTTIILVQFAGGESGRNFLALMAGVFVVGTMLGWGSAKPDLEAGPSVSIGTGSESSSSEQWMESLDRAWRRPEEGEKWLLEVEGLISPEALDLLATTALREKCADRTLLEHYVSGLEREIAERPGLITLKGTLGGLLAELGRPEAQAVLEEVVRESGALIDQGISSLFLAEIHLKKGDRAAARSSAERALACYDEKWVTERARAVLEQASGEDSGAKAA